MTYEFVPRMHLDEEVRGFPPLPRFQCYSCKEIKPLNMLIPGPAGGTPDYKKGEWYRCHGECDEKYHKDEEKRQAMARRKFG